MIGCEKIVVVGGGISGLLSSYLYSKKGHKVVLIEKDSNLGGLLKSKKLFSGLYYDYGTHFLKETGIEELDKFLFSNLDLYSYDFLKTGTYFNSLYEKNGFLNDEGLIDKDLYFEDFVNIKKRNTNFSNLKDQIINLYGKGYAENLILPAIEKLFLSTAEDLIPNAHAIFGLSRIFISNDKKTKELKKQLEFDSLIAYHSFKDVISELKKFYPKKNGVGTWIKALEDNLIDNGVEILKSTSIEKINIDNNSINSVETNSKIIEVEQLVWTLPPIFLLNLLNIKINSNPPKRLTSIIVDLELKGELLTDLFYVQNFHPSLKSFRVTMYNNYSKTENQNIKTTIEFLVNNYENKDYVNISLQELKEMKLISDATCIVNSHIEVYNNSFPILTKEFVESSKNQYDLLINSFRNLKLFGKSKGENWFMNDILKEIYNSIFNTNVNN